MIETDINKSIERAINAFQNEKYALNQFLKRITNHFIDHPQLNNGRPSTIHSVKSRIKSASHLEEKIRRKWDEKGSIDETNLFEKITDLIGCRILLLSQDKFILINNEINKQVESGEWFFHENPVAYTWDPETNDFFKSLGIETKLKSSYYTSVHYLVKPRNDSNIICEIQVRTLYEEIWGEIDHALNYPLPTENLICKEHLKILAKLTATGTKLVDIILLQSESTGTSTNISPQ